MQSRTAAVCSSFDSGEHRHHDTQNTQCCTAARCMTPFTGTTRTEPGGCRPRWCRDGPTPEPQTRTPSHTHPLLYVVVACPAVPQWQGCTRRAPLLLPLSSLAIHTGGITRRHTVSNSTIARSCFTPHHSERAQELQHLFTHTKQGCVD